MAHHPQIYRSTWRWHWSVFRWQRSTALLGLVLVAVVVACLSPRAATFADDEKKEKFPSVKEALSKELHGKFKLRKKQLQLQYDFRQPEQANDFFPHRFFGFDIGSNRPPSDKDKAEIEPGKLKLPGEGGMRLRAPFANITYAMIVAKGVSSFAIEFRGDDDKSVAASFDNFPRITVSGDEDFRAFRTINLLPEKEYRVELQVDRRKVVAKLNGKKLLEKKLENPVDGLGNLAFTRSPLISQGGGSSKAYVSRVIVRGTISDDAVVVAANRDRGKQKLAPQWHKTFTAEGKHFDVHSGVSADVARTWQKRLDQLVTTILKDYPTDVAPLPEPEPTPEDAGDSPGDEGEDEAAKPDEKPEETPVDKRPTAKEFALAKLTIYVFGNVSVHDAYRGDFAPRIGDSALPYASVIPETTILTFVEPDANNLAVAMQLQMWLLRQLSDRVFQAQYRTPPVWWAAGHNAYYAASFTGSGYVEGLVDPNLANSARKYLDEGTEPVVSDLLKGWVWKRGKTYPRALCWAWVHFLRHADDGAYLELAKKSHQGLRSGMSAKATSEIVFPVAKFNEIYPRFKEYVAEL